MAAFIDDSKARVMQLFRSVIEAVHGAPLALYVACAFEHSSCDRKPLLLARDPIGRGAERARDKQPNRRDHTGEP